MNKIIHLSLARKSVPVFMDVVQGATAPAIEFVLDDYTPPSNARARIYILKEGGEVYNNCTLSGNVVTYTPTAGSFDVPGQCVAQLELVQSSTVAVSWRIFVTVEPNLISGSSAPASTEFGALTSLIQSAQAYDGIIGANNITGYNNRQGWTNLTSEQDMNTVITPGVYAAQTNVIAQSLVNSPYKYAFKLVVEHSINNNNYIKQTAYLGGWANGPLYQGEAAESLMWRKTINGGTTWSEWIDQPQRTEVNAIANRGGKNLIGGQVSTVAAGVTYTVNEDGSISASGTSTGTSIIDTKLITLPPGRYIATGCPEGGGPGRLRMGVGVGTGIRGYDDGDGYILTLTEESQVKLRMYTFAATGDTTGITFYPMLRDASIQDDTYVPYGMSNAELTAIKPISVAIAGNGTGNFIWRDISAFSVVHITQGSGGGGTFFLQYVSGNIQVVQIASNGTLTAPTFTLDGNIVNIKNNASSYIRCVVIQSTW